MLEHLSYSSINTYLSCAANWKFKYVDELKTPASPELAFGSAFHNTVQAVITPGQKRGLLEIWPEQWGKHISKEIVDFGLDSQESFCNEGIRILSNPEVQKGILSIRPGIDDAGVKVERRVELKVPGVPLPVIGYIDVITDDGVPGDLKTSKSSWSADKASAETQPLFYLAALNQMGQKTPDWRFRHYIFVKTKTPQFQCIEHTHSPSQLMWLFKMIQNVWKGIEAGVFLENPTTWLCSPNYCNYWSLCRGK